MQSACTLLTDGTVWKAICFTNPVASYAFCCASEKGISLRGMLAKYVGSRLQPMASRDLFYSIVLNVT